MTESAKMMTLREKIAAMPTREEPLGGQRTKYVQRDEVLAHIDAHLALLEVNTEHVSVPREYVEQLQRALYSMGFRDDAETLRVLLSDANKNGHDPCNDECSENAEVRQAYANGYDVGYVHGKAILSRATPSDVRCTTCDGTGDVHRADGEWLGECTACDANKPSAPRVVTAPLSVFSSDMWTWSGTGQSFTKEEMDEAAFIAYRDHSESFATSLPAAVPDGEVRLWDTQWMSIVNHDNCYRDWSKDDAIAHAVKMTEQAIARNVADGKLPPKKIAAAPQSGEKEPRQ